MIFLAETPDYAPFLGPLGGFLLLLAFVWLLIKATPLLRTNNEYNAVVEASKKRDAEWEKRFAEERERHARELDEANRRAEGWRQWGERWLDATMRLLDNQERLTGMKQPEPPK